ncbi:peptidase S41 [Hyunsoonleella sp. SJ7]|uniref:Peptidase S41 n=1 Tax=Hyunsoonleella aquatilis TaxID=2762758 RepID=A0A923HCR1_9FLAO|nr:S41 family peptidase [Hyunsoonleella aquatilis]MBC3757693.1 peptidase S41 [Hyunsoonleella aquatilis]
MKKLRALTLILSAFMLTGCFEDGDDIPIQTAEINDFVWKGMSIYYLYKDEMPDLANDRFTNNSEYTEYLEMFDSPFDLFNSLKYQPGIVDQFSWMVNDYIELERNFSGISTTNGMEFSLFKKPNEGNKAIGVVRLVLPNSDAANKGIKRGDIFYAVDGIELFYNSDTDNNTGLLLSENYTISLGFFDDKGTADEGDDSVEPLDRDIQLSKFEYEENPIHSSKILEVDGEKVGYLMLNGFTAGYDDELNAVFGDFKANNVQHLVLDLRYNPGGRVTIETYLASMITGQFIGQIFSKLIYNSNFETTDFNFVSKIENGEDINALNLDKVYVLTTGSSASASEGLINGLNPYIEVIQIGTNTRGKTQASRTLYDSPENNYRREGANPRHTYAMQPLVADGVNRDNVKVPSTGLTPDIDFTEQKFNYGRIGEEDEPFLAVALAEIGGTTNKFQTSKSKQSPTEMLFDSNEFRPLKGGLVID